MLTWRVKSVLTVKSEKEMDEELEYELDDEDLDWLTNKLPEQKVQMKEDKFEQIIDRLEKESFKQGKMCDQSALEPYKLGGGKQVTAVYEYWSKKRSRLGKALIRRMQAPTPLSDLSPHNTFRPREKEEKKFRRTRKNDKDAHKKLKALQNDFKRAKEILERVLWREKIKKAILKVEFCLQFAKDINDIPPNIITENDEFCKEVRREKAKREMAKNAALGIPNAAHVPRPVPVPNPRLTLDGLPPQEELPAVSEERAQAIRKCFQHLMASWDPDRDCQGTSSLPVTADGKLCTEPSSHSGERLPFRGRARLGRGGRVVFDRCSTAVTSMHGAFSESGGLYGGGSNRGLEDEYMALGRPADRASAMWQAMNGKERNSGSLGQRGSRCDWSYLGGLAMEEREGDDSGSGGGAGIQKGAGGAAIDWNKRSLSQISGLWGMADGPYLRAGGGAAGGCGGSKPLNSVDNSMRPETAGSIKRARLADRMQKTATPSESAMSGTLYMNGSKVA